VGLTDKVSALIFALIVIAVIVYLVMSRFVIGPVSRLTQVEKIVLSVSIVGVALVIVYAAVELLLHIVF
jgi:hypothetical protein